MFKDLKGEVGAVGQTWFMPNSVTCEGESTQYKDISTNRSGDQGGEATRSLD